VYHAAELGLTDLEPKLRSLSTPARPHAPPMLDGVLERALTTLRGL
jgi:hypothetical protein